VTFVEDQLQATSPHNDASVLWGRGGWPGVVRRTAGYRSDKETAIDRSDREFCCYTQAENIKHFELRVVSECTVRMLAGWVVATRHSPRNVALAQL
jgi:hypothetical protein